MPDPMPQRMTKSVPLGQFARTALGAKGTAAPGGGGQVRTVSGSGAEAVGQIMQVRDSLMETVSRNTGRQMENAVEIETEVSEVRRLEVRNQRETLERERQERHRADVRREEIENEERLARIEALRHPAGDPVVEQLREQVGSLMQAIQGQRESKLEAELAAMKQQLDKPPETPASMVAQIEGVIALSDQIRSKFGGASDADRNRQVDLRLEALQRRQAMEQEENTARRAREEKLLDDDIEERRHKRALELRKNDQLEGLFDSVVTLLQKAVEEGNVPFLSAKPAAPAPSGMMLPPPPPPSPPSRPLTVAGEMPRIIEFPCVGCGGLVRASTDQNIAICPSCNATLDLLAEPDDAPPPVPEPFRQAFIDEDDPDAADPDELSRSDY